ncbi:alanine racemase [Altererythrobacter sp. H2]|uniref:alanine racemase n=1 Tax=Altererythrobacter sp. H2 TaxID=3108391 RepID=UPI002B4BF2E2|nr:alanine racemase [Altererythrobacter sp. H2]WRK97279.1 alanine racemase [Altererythrobacter sp. H2]
MPEQPPPTLRLRLDTEALAANWRALDRMSGRAQAGAAVKADCYGLGVDQCVPALRDAGVERYFIAHWSEAPAVLRHVPPQQVSVLHGPVTAQEAEYAAAVGLRPVINSIHQAQMWASAGGGECDLMVDTGINRLGVSTDELGDPAIAALKVGTLMSHLACADEDSPMNARQLAHFRAAAALVPARARSMANSAGIALGSDYHFDLTRPGLSLYGGVPTGALAGHIRQVAFPQAAVIQRRQLSAGDSVGYNATFVADRPMPVAVVSLGYADGFLRCWGGKGGLALQGATLPLLGRVSMDMVVVDATAAPDLREGDWLDVPYDLPQASAASGLSQYELLTVLGKRFAR